MAVGGGDSRGTPGLGFPINPQFVDETKLFSSSKYDFVWLCKRYIVFYTIRG